MFARGCDGRGLNRIVKSLSVSAALADGKGTCGVQWRDKNLPGESKTQDSREQCAAPKREVRQSPIPQTKAKGNLRRERFNLVNGSPRRTSPSTALHGRQRLWRVDIEKRALPLDRDFRHGFAMTRDQMPRADIAIERHEFAEEPP